MTKEVIRKTQKSKTGKKRIIVKTQPCESFFNVFTSKKMPETTEDDGEDSTNDKLAELLEEADIIHNDLYELYTLNALNFYLGFGDVSCCEPNFDCFV